MLILTTLWWLMITPNATPTVSNPQPIQVGSEGYLTEEACTTASALLLPYMKAGTVDPHKDHLTTDNWITPMYACVARTQP